MLQPQHHSSWPHPCPSLGPGAVVRKAERLFRAPQCLVLTLFLLPLLEVNLCFKKKVLTARQAVSSTSICSPPSGISPSSLLFVPWNLSGVVFLHLSHLNSPTFFPP